MSSYFHFSEAVSLAIHSLEIMARENGRVFTAKELAHRLNASESHLAKVFQRLAKTDLVDSHRGPPGGFALKAKHADITLLEVFTTIEGQVNLENCPLIKKDCPFVECMFSGIMNKFQREFKEFIETATLGDFIRQ